MNSVVRQMWEQNTDIVLVDTGNSYEGLCEYVGGKYISYTDEHPITMNTFRIKREEYNIEKIGFLKNLIMLIWKGTQGTVTKTEDKLIEQAITEYFAAHFDGKIDNLCFNTFYEFSVKRLPEICNENSLAGIDLSAYNYLMKEFYKGGNHDVTLNEDLDTSLFDETFIVFEIDSIKDDPEKYQGNTGENLGYCYDGGVCRVFPWDNWASSLTSLLGGGYILPRGS